MTTEGPVKFDGTTLSVSVTCGGATCSGTLTVLANSNGATIARAKKKKKTKNKQFTVASASFTIPSGQTRTIKLTLSSRARKLLAAKKRLPLVLVLNVSGQKSVRIHTTVHPVKHSKAKSKH